MKADEEKALADLAASGVRIPPQPRVVMEMQALLIADDYDMRKVAKVIAQDPGIVAMLFKVARSPVFKRAKPLTTLDQVLMTVGIKQTFNLVQAAALAGAVSDGTRKAFERFWTRAQEVAQIAAIIAEDRVSVCNVFPDQAYLAGIFHECGVPVLMLRFPDYCKALHLEDASCWPSLHEEDKRFNVDHVTVGYLVARHWKLPDFVCSAIRYHHEMPDEELGASISLIALLQAAVHFYNRLNHQKDHLWPEIGVRVMAEIGIPYDDEDDFFETISQIFIEAQN
ncbi:MAG: HDOD domain-containing protein [Rhodocyclaceae bacterium]|nr:HDOD domain-containing protein [Rhodocyclaceae bacterium]